VERFFLVCLGGAIGTGARYLVTLVAVRWLGVEFPYGTLTVNLVGAFGVGVIQALGMEALMISDTARLFLATGMMGGFTTYSAFSYETVRLMESGAWHAAWINVAVTTMACLGLCFLGIVAGRGLLSLR
jgi:CrcB protein